MANSHASLDALFTDIADAIREKTGDTGTIVADQFPDMIRKKLQLKSREAYLTFSSQNAFSIKTNNSAKNWNGTLEYSTDKKTWTEWNGVDEISAASGEDGYVLYFSGTGNTIITGTSSNYKWILTGTDIRCSGNIETLLDYATVESGEHPDMSGHCYYHMFSGCTGLTQAPSLLATTLTYGCYNRMFYGCTGLTTVPSLPATTLAGSCYYYMFYGCTSLTQAPSLPATTLENSCYYSMFYGCTSLTQAPSLPATTLANSCYSDMFRGCTGLTQAPSLPATTLANSCYSGMFRDCTGLAQAPSLAATTLAGSCYQYMFYGCTGLTTVPSLPATTLADSCYQYMFQDCTKIKLSTTQTGEYTQAYRIPTSGTGTTATRALSNMFASTGGTFKGKPSINTTYYLSDTNTIV